MAAATIDHASLSKLVEAGAVRGAHVVGQRGGWAVLVRYGMHERALAAQRSRQVRLFRKFETLVGYLRDIGIAKFEVNATDYDADALNLTRRPDAAEQLRRAHQAAAHDAWFRSEVEKALLEAKDPNAKWVDHASVRDEGQRRRSAWAAKAKQQT